MRLAIMQPYFFPYVGHFSLIAASDQWIVFDVCQYAPKTWMNRNRVLHSAGGWKWLTVPLANSSVHIRTYKAAILDPARLRTNILNQLSNYRSAPYHGAVMELLRHVLDSEDASLARLNLRGLTAVCQYLGLRFRPRFCSELPLGLPAKLGPGQWAPAIAASLGAVAYVNPIGGRELFDPDDFTRRNITLEFLEARPYLYDTGRQEFVPNLSILDALMWNPPAAVLRAIRDYQIVAGGPPASRIPVHAAV